MSRVVGRKSWRVSGEDERHCEVTRHSVAIPVPADRGIAGMCDNYRYGIAISHACQARLLVHGCAHVSIRGRANSCHSSGQGVLQRYIPCRCSVFSLGTPFFATRAKGGYAPCHCVHRQPPLFSDDRIPIRSLRPRHRRSIDPWTDASSIFEPRTDTRIILAIPVFTLLGPPLPGVIYNSLWAEFVSTPGSVFRPGMFDILLQISPEISPIFRPFSFSATGSYFTVTSCRFGLSQNLRPSCDTT